MRTGRLSLLISVSTPGLFGRSPRTWVCAIGQRALEPPPSPTHASASFCGLLLPGGCPWPHLPPCSCCLGSLAVLPALLCRPHLPWESPPVRPSSLSGSYLSWVACLQAPALQRKEMVVNRESQPAGSIPLGRPVSVGGGGVPHPKAHPLELPGSSASSASVLEGWVGGLHLLSPDFPASEGSKAPCVPPPHPTWLREP